MRRTHRHRAGCQTFQFAAVRWCVSHAEELITADPDAARLVDEVEIEPFGQFLPLQPAPPGRIKLIEVSVSPEHAARTDLGKPIMLAPIVSRSGERLGGIAIDGWHRIYHALSQGVTELPGYVLTESASRTAQLDWS